MADHFARPERAASSPHRRRLIAAGFIRRTPDRTLTVRATEAGVTGIITKVASDRAARVAELHRLCRADYDSAEARRRAEDHRDDAFLIARAAEAVNAR